MLTFRMIEAFRAVILSGSISSAAGVLHVSQPAVSRLIRDLEVEIGFRLFDRKHGRVFANEDALEFFEEIHRAFTGLDRIALAAKQIRKRESGNLRLAVMPAVGLNVISRVIAEIQEQYPGINVSLQIVRSTTVMQFLASLQCDVGIVESSYSAPSVEDGPSFDMDCICVLPKTHRLASETVITPEHLENEPFVSLHPDSQMRTTIDAIFETAGISRTMQTEAPLTNAICGLVLEGCGVSIVDTLSARSFFPLGLIGRPFRPTVEFSFRAYSTPRLHRTDLLDSFYESLAKALADKSLAVGPL